MKKLKLIINKICDKEGVLVDLLDDGITFKVEEAGGRKSVSLFDKINRDIVFKKIQDEIKLVMEKTKIAKHTQVETLYLFIILKELGTEYLLPQNVLMKYFCIETKDMSAGLKCKQDINVL